MTHEQPSKAGTAMLALGALGVVYGDIGTSPLYAFREAFEPPRPRRSPRTTCIGACSLVFWALIIVISIKYLIFVMRADNQGEGGILALTALLMRVGAEQVAKAGLLTALGVFGTALLYGDGMITPAISVLVRRRGPRGRSRTSLDGGSSRSPIVILVVLFLVQKRGTGGDRAGVRPDHDRVVRRARPCSACRRSSTTRRSSQALNPLYAIAVLHTSTA